MVRTCEFFVVKAVSGVAYNTNDKKLSTIYEAEKSCDFVFKHGVDIYRLSSSQEDGFHFFFIILRLENSLSPASFPFRSF